MIKPTAEQRLWARVNKSAPGGCWVYQGGRPQRSGHMLFWIDGKMRLVHRVAWEFQRGPIPAGKCVLHRCDVPRCVNADHLYIGTQADNARDRNARGREAHLAGTANGNARLTERKVEIIRRLHARGVTQFDLADLCGVSQSTISLIVLGKGWRHVEPPAVRT
jgi:hypothetical protein